MFADYKILSECIEREEAEFQVAESLGNENDMAMCYNRLEIAYRAMEELLDSDRL